jgi:hypothetical protein
MFLCFQVRIADSKDPHRDRNLQMFDDFRIAGPNGKRILLSSRKFLKAKTVEGCCTYITRFDLHTAHRVGRGSFFENPTQPKIFEPTQPNPSAI